MTTVQDVYNALFAAAPEYMKEDWDNVGLLCGRQDGEVTHVMVALDPTMGVVREAHDLGCQLVVTHHGLIFSPVKAVNDKSGLGRQLLFMIENHMASINLHTNLDLAPGGVNDILAATIGLMDVQVMDPTGTDEQGRPYGLIHVGTTPLTNLSDFAERVKATLKCGGVRIADGGKPVHKVAVGGGSCGGAMEEVAAAGCDTFVTADLKYHQFQAAEELGLNLIDAGHFPTENPVCGYLVQILRDAFPQLEVFLSKTHRDVIQFR